MLKKCPHCGGEARQHIDHNKEMGTSFIYIKCEVCGARGKTTSYKDDDISKILPARQMVAAAWNARV